MTITKVDNRTEEMRGTHTCFVKGRDTFLSRWGSAENGRSFAVWACRPCDLDTVFDWVRGRGDMQSVTTAFDPNAADSRNGLRPGDHLHIYAVNPGHPSLEEPTQ